MIAPAFPVDDDEAGFKVLSAEEARQLRLNNAIDLYKALGGGLNENTVSVAAKQ